ncbi:hypothetical protein KXW16_008215 [Aspergillus fumigatus]|nr:hypothetical protein KXW16_008215 [Aspergillus fumigatus]
MPPPGLFGRLIQNKRRLLWEKREGVDATLIVADVKFGVHSMILGAESPILQSRFQASLRKSGLREIIIEEADIHTVWRTLMLIYLGYYSTISSCIGILFGSALGLITRPAEASSAKLHR